MGDRALPVTWRLRTRWRGRQPVDPVARAASYEDVPGPVVVGGLGGSGTRVVEEVVLRLGVFTGTDLNSAGDNRWFTFLCKLPRWSLGPDGPESELARSLATLERAMTGRLEVAGPDGTVLRDALHRGRYWWRHDRLRDDRPPRWLRQRVDSLLRSGDRPPLASPWGWKEPNSHLMIRHLHRHFEERLRYVHVIRNGLDMAQSRNQLQVSRWGSLFGLADAGGLASPTASLDFWIRANEAAIAAGQELPRGRFLLLNYDELCAQPEHAVVKLAEFLDLRPSEKVLGDLTRIPRAAASTPRAACDADELFGPERLARVEALGFPVGTSHG
jgi:hypothetical protein